MFCIFVYFLELLDELSMIASKKYSNLDFPISPCLFMEFHGSKEVVKVQAKHVGMFSSCLSKNIFFMQKIIYVEVLEIFF